MASVWVQMREHKTPHQLTGEMDDGAAAAALQAGCNDWERSKPGRKAKKSPQNGLERIFCFSDGKVAGTIFIEPLPSSADPVSQ